MKKRYETPTTQWFAVELEQMIALSVIDTTDEIANNLSREIGIDSEFETVIGAEFDKVFFDE